MNKIELKGGVIAIGSLFWETKENCIDKSTSEALGKYRREWREANFEKESKIITLPIRYGRKSRSRKNTFTMVFSNGLKLNEYGKGKILSYKKLVGSFEQLEILSIELALAEGIYKQKNNKRIISTWGSVAIWISKNLEETDKGVYEYLYKKWARLFSEFKDTLNPKNYQIDESEYPTIDSNGMLTIDLKEKLDDYDFLFATPVCINLKKYPSGSNIAHIINESDYSVYFIENQVHEISTKDDNEIIENLNEHHKRIFEKRIASISQSNDNI